jgi:hypothetical protein
LELSSLQPDRVLDEYDGPRLFTLRSLDGKLLLAYQCGEDDSRERFLIVPADERLIADIVSNRIALRDALVGRGGWAWIVDRLRNGSLTSPGAIDPSALPNEALPRAGTKLYRLPDVLLRVRMIGAALTPEHIPSSVVRRAVDGTTGAVKTLVRHALSLLPSSGRPTESFRRYYDLPAVEFSFRSFEIAFGLPDSPPQADLMERETIEQVRGLLNRGLDWATANQGQEPERSAEWSAIVDALSKLAPPQKGAVDTVEISGALAGGGRVPYRLTREASERIGHARKLFTPDRRSRTERGYVREFDKDRLTFILRNAAGESILSVSFSEAQYDDALLAFDSEQPVTVVADEAPGSNLAELVSITFSAPDRPSVTT